jgi:hypothetical protein
MFKDKVLRLIEEFKIKRNALIDLIDSNRPSFAKKLSDNSFTDQEQAKILDRYGKLL